ncbi:MAG TPA: transcription termination factor Rho [Acidimicrobiales bacterium]|nr:transcription termination factor Rho [Acidimicrobiales bacterium]
MAGAGSPRSVLEGKERSELAVMAAALDLSVAPRAKKSDVIDAILQKTGAGDENAPIKRGPGRPRKIVIEPAGQDAERSSLSADEQPIRRAPGRPRKTTEAADQSSVAEPETTFHATPVLEGAPSGNGEVARTSYVPSQPAARRENDGSAPRPQGQSQGHQDRNSTSRDQNRDPNELGNRRGRRRGRGRDREREQGPNGVEQSPNYQGELVSVKGLLDLREEGYGFLRTSGYLPSPKDVYVSVGLVRRFSLRKGDAIEGACRAASSSEKYPALIRIDAVSGHDPEEAKNRLKFEDLTPLFPDSQLRLETGDDPNNLTARIVDLISPIGKGQRGLIVSPPKAGKTTIMKQIAHSIEANNPEVHLIVLLVDERPEEVTDMRRSVKGEVIASTFDRPAEEHTSVAELTIERAKRLVEQGKDVVIILDGITRLARAYNLAQPASGRVMSGGVDSGALYPPKKFFGAARNIEEGGSLTILATALVETGSRMDEVIFEEFKGTGNLELRLDRRLAERRLYPAIDVNGSSTRHEELLFPRSELQQVWKLRRVLNALDSGGGNPAAGLELLMDKLRTTKSNQEFLAEIAKAPTATA